MRAKLALAIATVTCLLLVGLSLLLESPIVTASLATVGAAVAGVGYGMSTLKSATRIQWNGENAHAVSEFCGDRLAFIVHHSSFRVDTTGCDNWQTVEVGDWIVRDDDMVLHVLAPLGSQVGNQQTKRG